MENGQKITQKESDQSINILIVAGDESIRQCIPSLKIHNFHVIEAVNGRIGLRLFRSRAPDLLLFALRTSEIAGIETLFTITRESPQTPVIVLAGKERLTKAIEALYQGAWDYVLTPIQEMPLLLRTLQHALEWARLMQANQRTRQELEAEISLRAQKLESLHQMFDREIAECRQAEKQIRQQHEFLERTLASLPHPFYVIDGTNYAVTLANSAARVPDLSEHPTCYALMHNRKTPCKGDMHPCPLKIVRETKKPCIVEHVHIEKNSTRKDVEIYANPLVDHRGNVTRIIACVVDITERKQTRQELEEIMIQSEKMIAIGGLAAGIAHELNNPLSGILQNIQVVLNRLTEPLPINERVAAECGITMEAVQRFVETRDILKMLEMVNNSGQQMAQIVEDMLSFSHTSQCHIFPCHDIRTLLTKTVELALHMYDRDGIYKFRQIEILQEYDPDLPEVPCEPTEIQQVVLNLLMNAAQAMTAQKTRTKAPTIVLRTAQNDKMVQIEVEDNGPGMPENVRKRVFDPFFTTKDIGAGTGLGLSVSYFIITKNHGGTIRIESSPGKGTTCIICLPLARRASS